MKYMLLIHQGTTPTPPSDEWESLSEDEKGAVYGTYQAINETPGVSPGPRCRAPRRATTVRVQDGKTIELNEGDYLLLSKAFFGEIENKYT